MTIHDQIRYATITAYNSLAGASDGSYIAEIVRHAVRSNAPTDSIRYENGVWDRLSDYPNLVFKERIEEKARNIRNRLVLEALSNKD